MNSIAIFGDLHAHPFPQYSEVVSSKYGNINSRLLDALNCVEQILDYCLKNNIKTVFFVGDLFHERKHIVTQAFNSVYMVLSMFKYNGIDLFMIPGNHDQADRKGEHHALLPFHTMAKVFSAPGEYNIESSNLDDLRLFVVPYIEDHNELKEYLVESNSSKKSVTDNRISIFLGHFGINGMKAGADFVYRNSYEPSPEDLYEDSNSFDVGFLGHFHIHQKVTNNFWYVGAPLQHNWGDSSQDRGFLVWNKQEGLKRVLLKSPKFVETTRNRILESNLEGNFVRLVTNEDMSEDRREQFKKDVKARYVQVVKPEIDVEEAFEARLKVDPSSSYKDMIKDYITSGYVDVQGLDPDKLVEIGQELISEDQ